MTMFLNPDSLEVLTGCKVEPSLADVRPNPVDGGPRYQFERLGYLHADLRDRLKPLPIARPRLGRMGGHRMSVGKRGRKEWRVVGGEWSVVGGQWLTGD